MKKIAFLMTNYIIRKEIVDESERDTYEFGFQVIVETFISLLISLLIALNFNMILEGILFFLIFIPLRSYAGGYHAERYIWCLFLSCTTFYMILITVKLINLPKGISFVLIMLLLLCILLLYPAENINRPINKKEQIYFKKKLKIYLTFDVVLAVLLYLLSNDNYLFLMMVTLIMIVITMIIGKFKFKKETKEDNKVRT